MTFLLSEDDALRSWLDGMTVVDQKADGVVTSSRQVGVWFGQPDQEIREQRYPYITIDMVDVVRDSEREMRGKVAPEYLAPSNLALNKGWEIDLPIPVNIDYQITTYARHPRHDRQLLAEIVTSRIPFRFGQLSLDDGTLRRLELISVSKRDNISEQAKRLFTNVLTVRIASEVVQTTLTELYKVLNVNDTLLTNHSSAQNLDYIK
jgi:hypothetical protein